MPLNFDVRNFTNERREQLAWAVHEAPDWKLPALRAWNYEPCRLHRQGWDKEVQDDSGNWVMSKQYTPKPDCRKCGIIFRQHQRIGIAWMYLKMKGLLADSMGLGKAFSKNEPVLTPLGWREIGSLQVGDLVIGSNGEPTEVLGVYPQGVTEIVRVTFNDGTSIRCSPDHLWEVQRVSGGKKHVVSARELMEGATRTISWESAGVQLTRDISMAIRGGGKAQNLVWAIPMVEPVQFAPASLDSDPYTLGVWLGDGSSRSLGLNLQDSEDIRAEFAKRGLRLAPGRVDGGGIRVHLPTRFLPKEVHGLRSWEKFVPERFLFASIADRLALLQGLLDTDGTPIRGGGVEYSTASPFLRDAVAHLAQSLGGTARIGKPRRTTYTHNGEKRVGRESYRVNVKLPPQFDPFLVSRKLGAWERPSKYPPRRLIREIVPDVPEESVCIRVAAEDSLYVVKDFIVTHNTTEIGGLIAMLIETGELSLQRDRSSKFGGMGRVIVVPRSAALYQWLAELLRMMPGLNVIVAEGTKRQRTQLYLQPWHVLLIGPEMMRQDYQLLERFDLALLVTDDIDQLRNRDTDTSYVLDRLGRRGTEKHTPGTQRYIIASGTPLQKRLPELHAILDGVGGEPILGTLDTFMRRHVRKETVREYNAKTGREERREVIVGYRNLNTLKRQIQPLVLRRLASDLNDVSLPTIMPNDVYLDLHPAQRRKYEELRKGVLQILKADGGAQIKRPDALAKIHYGAAICAGLAALGEEDLPGTSVKMDWVMDALTGDLSDEKVVLFVNLKNSVRAMQDRMRKERIGFVTVWGEETDKRKRMEAQERFWNDPNCRVLIGTKAIEQSLNLQVARHLINMDIILNPARMAQLAGRIRRDGSAYSQVFVHNLLTVKTQEERYMPMLEREQALSDFVWDENNQLFKALDPMALLQLIAG